jgi:hypothetical protein
MHGAGQHVGNRFDAAMRMPGKPGLVVTRLFPAEVIKQQERIKLVRIAEAESPVQLDAGTFQGRLSGHDTGHSTDRHETRLLKRTVNVRPVRDTGAPADWR